MNQKDIIQFFNELAPEWDKTTIRNDSVINQILDNAYVTKGKTVLDVACGTGVLIPDYIARNVLHVTGVDISSEMIKLARDKFHHEQVSFLCADIESLSFEEKFDCIMIYNAFPHFPNPSRLLKHLSAFLRQDGTLTVAHGMSRDAIDSHHKGVAGNVSLSLPYANDLASLFPKELEITTILSTHEMYQVTGRLL